jgi:hypothetical protein
MASGGLAVGCRDDSHEEKVYEHCALCGDYRQELCRQPEWAMSVRMPVVNIATDKTVFPAQWAHYAI